ncbi:hypothetical protein PP175_09920 [Aneurinibacillus sp. Ricciae_BoGa-3]|uniref:hypothetical protein n=1 Tax=Aneurinibacillus sp. Ricciae_BoGa-3 TaxID=3022697 RepID=UPI0023413B8F|nr:hypothetical protein [Aneurinibacillus sp. Ricciae_BoGa-3]WCK56198.1 hypothetical protein PP175_09920 [Aneurinibacillus sp. Ricciae_BoGa-3]
MHDYLQIQNTVQMMRNSEDQNAAMLRETARQLEQMAQRESMTALQLQQLYTAYILLFQENQRLMQAVTSQSMSQQTPSADRLPLATT